MHHDGREDGDDQDPGPAPDAATGKPFRPQHWLRLGYRAFGTTGADRR